MSLPWPSFGRVCQTRKGETETQSNTIAIDRNPAEMSEKDWHAVTRINSILNGHRFAFAQSFKKPTSSDNNPGNAQVEEGTLIFRRIERAPYTGVFERHDIPSTSVLVGN